MKYIPQTSVRYDTNFDDEILSVDWNESDLEMMTLRTTRLKQNSMYGSTWTMW